MYQKTKAMKLRLNQKIDKAPLNLYIKLSVPLIKTEVRWINFYYLDL